jgi:hypothetical protein
LAKAALQHSMDLAQNNFHSLHFRVNSVMKLFAITPKYALGRAGFAAGRNLTVVEPGNTKIALYCQFCVIIKLHRPKRTGLEAFPAANTKLIVNEHQPAFIPDNGFHRT